jgi:hypothetical protein
MSTAEGVKNEVVGKTKRLVGELLATSRCTMKAKSRIGGVMPTSKTQAA